MKLLRLLAWPVLLGLGLLGPAGASAHSLPDTVVLLDIRDQQVDANAEMPLPDLGLAMHENLEARHQQTATADAAKIRRYLLGHIRPTSAGGKAWKVVVGDLRVGPGRTVNLGSYSTQYHNLIADIKLTPPAGADTRIFNLGYDAVVSGVPTHTVLVHIRQDWSSGITRPGHNAKQIGVIGADGDGKVTALKVDVSRGSLWKGFVAMVALGMQHIRSGTDHLLFLLTLLLPAPLLVVARRWGGYAGLRPTFMKIFKIATAFTIGHSLTLIVATLAMLRIPAAPVEALIAVSIIVSAVHALRPIFPGREIWVAGGFGLIHGMAFSFTLAELELNRSQTALSLLGFNLGIEIMQIIVIIMVVPSLVVLAQTAAYPNIRRIGASLALVAATGWLIARLGAANPVGALADSLSGYAIWIVFSLAVAAIIVRRRTLITFLRRGYSAVKAGAAGGV